MDWLVLRYSLDGGIRLLWLCLGSLVFLRFAGSGCGLELGLELGSALGLGLWLIVDCCPVHLFYPCHWMQNHQTALIFLSGSSHRTPIYCHFKISASSCPCFFSQPKIHNPDSPSAPSWHPGAYQPTTWPDISPRSSNY